MSDLINRQQAIEAVAKWIFEVFGIKESDGTATVFKRLRELPSAQQERKPGKWIKDGFAYSLYKCSVCNDFCTVAGYADCVPEKQMYKVFKFCPNCGAKMEGNNE